MNKNNFKTYAKVIEELDNIKNKAPERGGALYIATENDNCVFIKHGESKEVVEALVVAAVTDDYIYQMLSAAVGIARMKRFICR